MGGVCPYFRVTPVARCGPGASLGVRQGGCERCRGGLILQNGGLRCRGGSILQNTLNTNAYLFVSALSCVFLAFEHFL
jgi:hypothetical protein